MDGSPGYWGAICQAAVLQLRLDKSVNCCQNSKIGAVSHHPEYPAPDQLCVASAEDPQDAAAVRVLWCEYC